MFAGCKLDAESLKRIAISLSKTDTPNTIITINLGMDYVDNGNGTITPTDAGIIRDLNLISHKGWSLSYFGDFDYAWADTNLKYAGCNDTHIIKIKDANYLTTDIVNGAWTEHLPDLETGVNEEGESMFKKCSNLTSFNADLSSLTNGNTMFWSCSNLESFNSNLSNLTTGNSMFWGCRNLTSFSSKLSNLMSGASMFAGCSNLESFSSNLSSLTDGGVMF